ncbi:MAG TPA: hypothetical protein DCO75_00350, partial [Fibrobacteres bacterium]|nr:hypothetical protein [Fibrobacterota bacterium]
LINCGIQDLYIVAPTVSFWDCGGEYAATCIPSKYRIRMIFNQVLMPYILWANIAGAFLYR